MRGPFISQLKHSREKQKKLHFPGVKLKCLGFFLFAELSKNVEFEKRKICADNGIIQHQSRQVGFKLSALI